MYYIDFLQTTVHSAVKERETRQTILSRPAGFSTTMESGLRYHPAQIKYKVCSKTFRITACHITSFLQVQNLDIMELIVGNANDSGNKTGTQCQKYSYLKLGICALPDPRIDDIDKRRAQRLNLNRKFWVGVNRFAVLLSLIPFWARMPWTCHIMCDYSTQDHIFLYCFVLNFIQNAILSSCLD